MSNINSINLVKIKNPLYKVLGCELSISDVDIYCPVSSYININEQHCKQVRLDDFVSNFTKKSW